MLGHIWSDKSIISVIRCGTPSDGILADKAWTDDILGSVVSYTCHISARRISGDLSRTCLDTRIWNGTVLECQGKRLDKRLDSICVCIQISIEISTAACEVVLRDYFPADLFLLCT